MKPFLTLQLSTIFTALLFDGSACDKIYGGQKAKPHSRPYMVFIYKPPNYCEGILIKPDWVLTAAHCALNLTANVILGAHNIFDVEKGKQRRKICRKITHENYKPNNYDYDVELLQLCKEAKLSDTVKTLGLPEKCVDPVGGTVCEVAGWGTTTNLNNKMSDVLMEANVTILDRIHCYYRWKGTMEITTNMICTSETLKTEPCKGDSGGPLICKGELRGIISFGQYECGCVGNAAVYTFLNSRISCWIYKQLSGMA